MLFGEKCDKELVGQSGGRTLLDVQLWSCFSLYKLPKTVTVTTLLLFGHVTLLCGKFLFIKLSEGPVELTDCPIDTPSIREAGLSVHTGLVLQ